MTMQQQQPATVTGGDPAVVDLLRQLADDADAQADHLAEIGGTERRTAHEHLRRATEADDAAMAARAHADRWRRHLELELGTPRALPRGGRPVTPDAPAEGGGTVITMQRCCNGCGLQLGDATAVEVSAAADGWPLPDVRGECPTCSPDTAAERSRTGAT